MVITMIVAITPIIGISTNRRFFLIRILLRIWLSSITVDGTFSIIKTVGRTACTQMLITLMSRTMGTFLSFFVMTMVHTTGTTSIWLLLVLNVVVLVMPLTTTPIA